MKKTGCQQPRVRVAGMATRGNTILLVNHVRDNQSYYLLPGGGLEWQETLEAGLSREFKEELSLDIKVGKLLCLNQSISPDGKRHIIHVTFRVSINQNQEVHVHVDKRLKGAIWMPVNRFKKIRFYPEIRKNLLSHWQNKNKAGAAIIKTPWL